MKKIKLLVLGLVIALGLNAQKSVWLSGEDLQPALVYKVNSLTGNKEVISVTYLVIEVEKEALNADSAAVGRKYNDSTLVSIKTKAKRLVYRPLISKLVEKTGYLFYNKEKASVRNYIINLYNPDRQSGRI